MNEKFTLHPTQYPKDDVFMVCGILRQAHLKEVGLAQNWETVRTQNLTTLDLL